MGQGRDDVVTFERSLWIMGAGVFWEFYARSIMAVGVVSVVGARLRFIKAVPMGKALRTADHTEVLAVGEIVVDNEWI